MNKIQPIISEMLGWKGIRRGCVFVVAGVHKLERISKSYLNYFLILLTGVFLDDTSPC